MTDNRVLFKDALGNRTIPRCFSGLAKRAESLRPVPTVAQCAGGVWTFDCPDCDRMFDVEWKRQLHLLNPKGWCVEFARKHKLGKFS